MEQCSENSPSFGLDVAIYNRFIIASDLSCYSCVSNDPSKFSSGVLSTPAIYIYNERDAYVSFIGKVYIADDGLYYQPFNQEPKRISSKCTLCYAGQSIDISKVNDIHIIYTTCGIQYNAKVNSTLLGCAIILDPLGHPYGAYQVEANVTVDNWKTLVTDNSVVSDRYVAANVLVSVSTTERTLCFAICDLSVTDRPSCNVQSVSSWGWMTMDSGIVAYRTVNSTFGRMSLLSQTNNNMLQIDCNLSGINSSCSVVALIETSIQSSKYITTWDSTMVVSGSDVSIFSQYNGFYSHEPFTVYSTLLNLSSPYQFVSTVISDEEVVLTFVPEGSNIPIPISIRSCPRGTQWNPNNPSGHVNSTCSKCPPGQYNSRDEFGPCFLCPAGFYTPSYGSRYCIRCDPSEYCPAGSVWPMQLPQSNGATCQVIPLIPPKESFDFNSDFYIFCAPYYFFGLIICFFISITIILLQYFVLEPQKDGQPKLLFRVIGISTWFLGLENFHFKKLGMDRKKPNDYAKHATISFLLTLLILISWIALILFSFNFLSNKNDVNLSIVNTVQPLYSSDNSILYEKLDGPPIVISVDLYAFTGNCGYSGLYVDGSGFVNGAKITFTTTTKEQKDKCSIDIEVPSLAVATFATIDLHLIGDNLYTQYINYSIATKNVPLIDDLFSFPYVDQIGQCIAQGSITPFTLVGTTTDYILRKKNVVEIATTIQMVHVCDTTTSISFSDGFSLTANTTGKCKPTRANTKIFTVQDVDISRVNQDSFYSLDSQGIVISFQFSKNSFYFNTRLSRFVSEDILFTLCAALLYLIYLIHRFTFFPLLRILHRISQHLPETKKRSRISELQVVKQHS